MKTNTAGYQKKVLTALSGRIDDFYLAGGTALSLFYFKHRTSVDLDFFTHAFAYSRVTEITEYLKNSLNKRLTVAGQNLNGKSARMVIYNIHFTARDLLKLDFVEDTISLLKETRIVDGIHILSLEDIYLRKLYALAGMIKTFDEAGRPLFAGGRMEAKDFYDIYILSHTFMPLSKFIVKYCDRMMVEAVIRWFRTFDRMSIIDGVLTLDTNKAVDYKALERHFKEEIDRLINYEIGGI